jgi:hypothetical protein
MRIFPVVVICICVAIAFGCTSTEPKTTKAEVVKPAGPGPTDPQEKWVQGKVFRVWPFQQGELMAYLGTQNGIHNGDTLALKRGAVTINTVQVLDAREDIFYGRVIRRDDDVLLPREGDVAVVVPATDLPEPEAEPAPAPKKKNQK